MREVVIYSDFDGTISEKDTLVEVFDTYCSGSWRDYEIKLSKGEIDRRQSLAKEVELLQGEMDQFLTLVEEEIPLRAGFREFVEFVEEKQFEFRILSGGFQRFIDHFFKRESLTHLKESCEANEIVGKNSNYSVVENSSKRVCGCCPNCKTHFLRERKAEGEPLIVYIGDGKTDYCPALEADVVYATGSLASYMKTKKRPYIPFDSFHQVVEGLKQVH